MQFQSLSPSITVTRLRPHACQRHTEGKKIQDSLSSACHLYHKCDLNKMKQFRLAFKLSEIFIIPIKNICSYVLKRMMSTIQLSH